MGEISLRATGHRILGRHVRPARIAWPAACCWLLLFTGCTGSGSGHLPVSLKDPFGRSGTGQELARSPASQPGTVGQPGQSTPQFGPEMARARQLENAGKHQEARTIYEKMIVAYPNRYEPYLRLGVVADKQRRFTEAQALYAQAIRINPRDPEVFNDLGYCLFLQGRLEKSEQALRKAVGLSPSNPRFRNNLGLVYGHQGRHQEAFDQFRRAGSEADAHYNMAFLFAALNSVEEAKNCFRRALAADPTCERARRALRSFEQAEQDPHGLADNGPIVQNGIRWVPYVEGQPSDSEASQWASHADTIVTDSIRGDSIGTGRLVPSTRPATQAQLRRARSMVAERIPSR